MFKYIQMKRTRNIHSTEDNEPTFSSYVFQEGPVFNVETIEERLNEMILDRVQKKEEKLSS